MWARSVLLLAGLAGTASAEFDQSTPLEVRPVAEPPRLRIGHPGDRLALDKISLAIQQDALGLTASVTLSVSTTESVAREAVIGLEVPHGARVTGVALTIGTTERMVALASSAESARVDYQRVREQLRDPILVEWKSTGERGDVLEVRAFPLTKGNAGRIELTIELPEITSLTLEASAPTIEVATTTRRAYRRVKRPITIDVPGRRELELPLAVARPSVDPATSFYAGAAPSMVMPTIVLGGHRGRHVERYSADKHEIRKEVKRHMARLARCWERAVEYRGGPEGEAMLHFAIDPAGKIASTTIDGTITDPAVTSCLAGVVAQFEFRAGDSTVVVNYPLRFKFAGS